MKFIWWNLEMSYHTAYPSWDCPAVVSICFCIPSYVHQQLHSLDCQMFGHHNSLRFSFLKGDLQISKLFKNTICIGVCTLKCTKTVSSLLPPSIFSLSLYPIQTLKEALNIPPGMYCLICLSEIMRLSAFKSPLFYPSS
jgi:hypothetical protein